jgi:hypothetical protein
MTYTQLQELAGALSLSMRIQYVWPGPARALEKLRGSLVGRRIAEFPLVLLERK